MTPEAWMIVTLVVGTAAVSAWLFWVLTRPEPRDTRTSYPVGRSSMSYRSMPARDAVSTGHVDTTFLYLASAASDSYESSSGSSDCNSNNSSDSSSSSDGGACGGGE